MGHRNSFAARPGASGDAEIFLGRDAGGREVSNSEAAEASRLLAMARLRYRDFLLDLRHCFGYMKRIPLTKGASGGDPDGGAGAVPAGDLASRSRAAWGIILAGTTTGARGAAAGLGQAGPGNARQTRKVSAPRLGRALRTERSGHVPGSMALS